MIKTLRRKFIMVNMLLVALVLLIVFSTQCITSYGRIQNDNIRNLERILTRRDDQRLPRFEIGQAPPPDFMRDPVFVVHVDQNGEIKLIASGNISSSEERLVQLAAEAESSGQDSGILREYNLRYMKKYDSEGVKIAFIDLTNSVASIRNVILTSVLSCAAALAAFFFISLFLSKWALGPVEQAWLQQRQFVADASHELKTPLTVILTNIGILKANRSDTVERQIRWVENTEAEAGRMKKLVDNLLFLAKADDSRTTLIYSKINFSDIIFGSALTFEPVGYERGVAIDTDSISPDVFVSGDESQLGQLSGILLDNAVKYSESGGIVTLSLTVKQEKVVFSVHNSGSHLETGELEHVFDRFYRADKSRANEGYGLGLSIAKSIVESHQGKISADSNKEKGTTFTVVMPLYNQHT